MCVTRTLVSDDHPSPTTTARLLFHYICELISLKLSASLGVVSGATAFEEPLWLRKCGGVGCADLNITYFIFT